VIVDGETSFAFSVNLDRIQITTELIGDAASRYDDEPTFSGAWAKPRRYRFLREDTGSATGAVD
jgi:hypothetical protein